MNLILARVGLIALVLLTGFIAGIKVQEWRFDAKERAKLQQSIERLREDVETAKSDHEAVANVLGKKQAENDRQKLDYERRLRDERKRGTQLVVGCEGTVEPGASAPGGAMAGPGSQGDGDGRRPTLTGDFVRLWDIALRTGEAAGNDTGTPDGAGETPGPIGAWDALDNLAENAGRWKACRDTVAGWQDLARRRGWVSQ
jgi:hypothetical protein